MRDGPLLQHIGLQVIHLNVAMCDGITPRHVIGLMLLQQRTISQGVVLLRLPRSIAGVVLHRVIRLCPGVTAVRDLTTMEPVAGNQVVFLLVNLKL